MTGIDVIPYAVAEHMAAEMILNMLGWGSISETPAHTYFELRFFACFTTSGWGRIRAGHRILCTCGTGRSAGRRWPGLLASSMHAEASPWLMDWLLKLIQLPENVAQLS